MAGKIRHPAPEVFNPNNIKIEGGFGKYTALGFRSAKRAASEARSYSRGSGDAHMQFDRPLLIRESRAHYRDNPIYKGMIDTAVDYIIGEGFQLDVTSGSKALNEKVQGLWKSWFSFPEIKGLLDDGDMSQMICREMILCGDTLAIKTNKGLLQLIEAEQIACGPGATNAAKIDGIEKNTFGTPTSFWVAPYKSGYVNTQKARTYSAFDVLFLTAPDRPSSTRGVPAAQASFPMLHRINDICDSEAIAWQMLSRLAVTVNKEQAGQDGYDLSREDPNKSGDQTDGDLATRLTELDYALMFWGKPGEEIKGVERNIPGMNFSESLRTFLRLLGLPLGLPLELVLLDWTKSNYSQSRAVLEQAFRRFKKVQRKMEHFFFTPLFEWKLEQWRKSERLGNIKNIPYSWIKPTFPWIDQLKEAQARGEAVDRGFMTHGEVCKSRGMDRSDIVSAREAEVIDAIETAQRIEEKYDGKVKVPWQIFAGLEAAPAPAAPAPAAGEDKERDDDDEEEKEKKEGSNQNED